jgi:hypothetical protein
MKIKYKRAMLMGLSGALAMLTIILAFYGHYLISTVLFLASIIIFDKGWKV